MRTLPGQITRATSALRCACGAALGATWPHADVWGRPVCLDCLGHEQADTWPDKSLSIALPQGGAYGREGKR